MKGTANLTFDVTRLMEEAGYDTDDATVAEIIQYSVVFAVQELEHDASKRDEKIAYRRTRLTSAPTTNATRRSS